MLRLFTAFFCCWLLAGCGQKGPLVLPEPEAVNPPVTEHPVAPEPKQESDPQQ
ncbi:LPS translocon maturation chaperone LptM [Ferrimonas sediminum]|uniref:LPS translocon maturation chaperone LptM n=1 Tax=Ferrimonas sediminum TaxID=718193 RepID=UPI00115FE455